MSILPYSPLDGDRPELSIPLHDGTEEQISIVVVHNNQPAYLNLNLQSIAITSINNNYEIVVVDNGSGSESQAFLDEVEANGVKVIRNEKNLFWSAAANQGFAACSRNSKYIIFMHYDVVILNPGWLDLLTNVAESGCGMVGLELAHYESQGQKMGFVQEWCLMVSRNSWKDIGPWPETLPQIGHAFLLTMRAQLKGHNPTAMKTPIAHHYHKFSMDINQFESQTESAMKQLPRLMMELNK